MSAWAGINKVLQMDSKTKAEKQVTAIFSADNLSSVGLHVYWATLRAKVADLAG